MRKFSLPKIMCVVFIFCATPAIGSPAQTSATLKTLHSFSVADGNQPYAGLVQGTDGNLYGTTYYGGAHSYGTVFKITTGGTLTTLHSFNIADGQDPEAGLVQATDGNFYGTTAHGGGPPSYGTVFKITTGGTLTTLHSFASAAAGYHPAAGLVQGIDGNFYGTTFYGGAHPSYGTVFKITPGGIVMTLHNFANTDGANPAGVLVQATDGNFYGTTIHGGAHPGNGTVFKITASGALTTIHSFDQTDGSEPQAGLVQATDGNFYGTTFTGGAGTHHFGTVFKITSTGTLTTLHSFGIADGSQLKGGLVQATDGNFYGTTSRGGAHNDGTVFKLSVGLAPLVGQSPSPPK